MLSPRDAAQGAYREQLSMGHAGVLGGDMAVISAGRLDRVRRAERSIEAAFDSQRTALLEPNDDVLDDMLRQTRKPRRTLEADVASHELRGGPSEDAWSAP